MKKYDTITTREWLDRWRREDRIWFWESVKFCALISIMLLYISGQLYIMWKLLSG